MAMSLVSRRVFLLEDRQISWVRKNSLYLLESLNELLRQIVL
jgi:hypothetical protein